MHLRGDDVPGRDEERLICNDCGEVVELRGARLVAEMEVPCPRCGGHLVLEEPEPPEPSHENENQGRSEVRR